MMEPQDTVPESQNPSFSPKPALDVGMTLRVAREGLGLSVHDIANRIKFAPRQVESLEANDFEHLPQATFLRGFVRSYARVLQLDEEMLIAALPDVTGRKPAPRAQSVNVTFPAAQALRRVNLLWLAGALGVALLLGLFVLLQNGSASASRAETVVEAVDLPGNDSGVATVANSDVQSATPAKTAEVPVPVVQSVKPPEAPVPKPAPPAAPKRVVVPEIEKSPIEAAPSPAPVPVSAPAASSESVSATEGESKPTVPLEILKRRPLHFIFDEASWAEVIDVNGNVLLSRDVPRGGEKWIGGPGRAPYSVSIKNPAKVRLYNKGTQVDLSAYAKMEIAHFKVN